jgi:CRISPR/Cas system-associated endoribonuclease Cas2
MNIEKLKEYESEFLEQYPNGFDDRNFSTIMKTYKPLKLEEFAKDALKKENFQNPSLIVDGFLKVVQKSVFVSVFDKLKLKDMIATLNSYEKDMLSIEIYELLYGNKKKGFEGLVEFLSEYKLAKWTIISVVPYCINRHQDYFIKPTTTKNIIKTFELEDCIYKTIPSFEFYDKYTKALDIMKSSIDKSLSPDNVGFTAFLKVAIESYAEIH